MNHKAMDGVEIWKQFEDLLIPELRLSVLERAVYSYLVRHSRLEGKARLALSMGALARGAVLGGGTARRGVRGLAGKGALRLAERGQRGHVIFVRLPEEVRGVRAGKIYRERRSDCGAPSIWRKPTFWESGRCGERSMRARAGTAFIAGGG